MADKKRPQQPSALVETLEPADVLDEADYNKTLNGDDDEEDSEVWGRLLPLAGYFHRFSKFHSGDA